MASEPTMRALLLTKPSGAAAPTLSFTAQQRVPVPPPGHLLVRIHASAIQPSDIMNARGAFGLTTFPRVPGRDFSGVVVASGDNNSIPSPFLNKAVFGTSGSTHAFTVDGFQADYAVISADSITAKPDALSHVQAATLGVPFTTAALVIKKSGAKKGESVLVLGANGAVGRTVCVLLEDIGCRVIRAVRGPGGDVDTSVDPELKTVRQSIAPNGVDAVIDTVGMPLLTKAAVEAAMGHGGRLVFISAPKTDQTAELSFRMLDFYRAEKSAIGINTMAHSSGAMTSLLAELDHLFASGKWRQAAGTWEVVSLEDAPAAYKDPKKDKKYVINLV